MVAPNRTKTVYVCQSCGSFSPRWVGKCPSCGAWNSMNEERSLKIPRASSGKKTRGQNKAFPLSQIALGEEQRVSTGFSELDRTLGGGIVKGSVALVGGDPGIGKSTLLLQASDRIAKRHGKVLYISGEESKSQIKIRAQRLGIDSPDLKILTETSLEAIIDQLKQENPVAAVVDSIQTTHSFDLESPAGTISQIRECTSQFLDLAKGQNIPLFLIGHVTKEGAIAGPKVLEHMVDTVLYFEGEKNYSYRILRTMKNRFGKSGEIGVFQMDREGILEVSNPSEIFLAQSQSPFSGSTVVSAIEGTRPILLEVQALVSPTNCGVPQRVSTGIDPKRLSLLLAILEKKEGIHLGVFDVFVNVVGGIRVDEPGADLGVCLSLISSFKDAPVLNSSVVIGEVGLGGEVRCVTQIEERILEAEKLGFKRCLIPHQSFKTFARKFEIEILEVKILSQATELVLT
jgi:DNA repair protein RadA/Sms